MKTLLLALLISISILIRGQSNIAYEIMSKSVQSTFANQEIAKIKLILINKHGNEKVRTFEQFSKIDNKGNRSLYIRILSPYILEGTSFLSIENTDNVNDQWFYFPPLNVLKHVPPGKQSRLIDGTDFSFEDLKMERVNNYHYIYLSEKYVDRAKCYQIKALPKTNKTGKVSAYSKRILFIDMNSYVLRKAYLYDKSGRLFKEYHAKDIRKVGNLYRAFHIKMTNLIKPHSTILVYEDLVLDNVLEQKCFTVSYLKK